METLNSNEEEYFLAEELQIDKTEIIVLKSYEQIKTPIPWKSALILLLVTASEGISFSIYLAFTAVMAETQFGIPNEEVGYYVGFLATGYYFGQLISNYPAGIISDKIGRKPLLLLGFNIFFKHNSTSLF